MASESLNIYIIGVGGFGTGSLSNVLATAAQLSGLEAVGSETHGLAQRGGVVVSTLRLGKGLSGSPLIIKGTADVLVALEPLEALRSLPFLRSGGTVAYNTQIIQPLGVRLGGEEYPDLADIEALARAAFETIPDILKKKAADVVIRIDIDEGQPHASRIRISF